MTKIRLMLHILAVSLSCLFFSSIAHAQLTRTWVSGVGSDANPCSRTAPCQTFLGAFGKTVPGGEITVLDPGNYGPVNITNAVTINGDGSLAGILTIPANSGIVVTAGANDVVRIRGISINGNGVGFSGIQYISGKRLEVENCSIYDFTTG